jgi:very-short-patch-repair endonuclease
MPTESAAARLENAVNDYVSGIGYISCSKRWHLAPKTLRRVLEERGLFDLGRKPRVPDSKPESLKNLERAVGDYSAGKSITTSAAENHVGYENLRRELIRRGLLRSRKESRQLLSERASKTRREKLNLPDKEIAERFLAGESVKALAESYGVSRGPIAVRLKHQGIEPRSQSEAMKLRMSRMTPEERLALAAPSHRAARRKHTEEERAKMALSRERNRTHVSPGEEMLEAWLAERGIVATPQKAVGRYNIDLAVGTIAVEIFGGGWHGYGHHKATSLKRFRYLLDRGWTVVVVWLNAVRFPLTPAVADYLVTFVEQARRDPSLRGQYRVIRGDGQEMPVRGDDLHELTVPPSDERLLNGCS